MLSKIKLRLEPRAVISYMIFIIEGVRGVIRWSRKPFKGKNKKRYFCKKIMKAGRNINTLLISTLIKVVSSNVVRRIYVIHIEIMNNIKLKETK